MSSVCFLTMWALRCWSVSGLRSRFTVALSGIGLVFSLTAVLLVGSGSPAGAVAGYGDVGESTWYTDAVQWAVDNEITGVAGFCFAPETPVSRGETAVWIYNMENQPDAGERHPFTDVTDVSQDDAISWMADNEITTGTSPTTFAPDETLRRAQVATFLHRLKGEPSAPPHSFSDVVADWQQDAVSWMAHTGITTGTSPTTFAPEDTLTRAHLVTFLYRYQGEPEVTVSASSLHCNPNNIPGYNPDIFYTEENDLSRFIKEEIVDRYAEDNPWLLETWNHTNRPDFEYAITTYTSQVAFFEIDAKRQPGETLDKYVAFRLGSGRSKLNDRKMHNLVHELAHVYTESDGATTSSGPIAIAHLYFDQLSDGNGLCTGGELYAEAAEMLVPSRYNYFTYYWHNCSHLPSRVTPEAIKVVEDAFAGRTPRWFYDTFQKADGSLDYEMLWTAVRNMLRPNDRKIVVYQLRNEFGGYCSEQAARDSAFGDLQLAQPWRDGGCPTDS